MSLIIEFVEEARDVLRAAPSIDRFIELRYKIMPIKCPHDVFSVDQANLNFFEVAYNHIMGYTDLPKNTQEHISEYHCNYLNWVRKAQIQIKEFYPSFVVTVPQICKIRAL